MSPVDLSCPACARALRVSGVKPGCRIRCPRCGEVFAPPTAGLDPEPTPVTNSAPAAAPPAPASVTAHAPPVLTDEDIFAKIAEADDPVAAAAEVRKPKITPGEPGNPLPLDDPPPAPPAPAPKPANAARKRRAEARDEDEPRAALAINPVWLLGGLCVLAVGVLVLGVFVLSRHVDPSEEEAAAAARRERDATARRERADDLAKPAPKPAPKTNPPTAEPARPHPVNPDPDPERPDPIIADPMPVFPQVQPQPQPFGPNPVFPNNPVFPPGMGLPPAFPPNMGLPQPAFPPGFPNRPPGRLRPPRPPGFQPEVVLPLNPPVPAGPMVTEERPDIVHPTAAPAPITPTVAADQTEIRLPGPVDLTCFGGGGRYVLLRIPSAKQVAVLDVCAGKIAKYLPLPEEGALIAAGNEHLFVMAPTDNVIQRWNLVTFEKERTVANPLEGPVRHLLVGHATDGPLYVIGPNKVLDTNTFKEVSLGESANGRALGMWNDARPATVNVSADGRVLAWHRQGASPSGLSALVIGPTRTKSHYEHVTVGAIIPGPDGTLFTSVGLFTPELKSLGEKTLYRYWHHAPVPAAHGKLYLSVLPVDDLAPDKPAPRVVLKMVGENRALGDLSGLAGLGVPRDFNEATAKGLQLHNRLFLVPDAKALVVLHGTADRVTIHAFDTEAVMAKSDFDFLFVTSKPTRAVCGETFTYKPEVKSRRGGVKVKRDAGPEGMRVTEDGTVTWAVPANFADTSVPVTLTITDRSGQEVLHTFTLPVVSRP
ncbi:hypothetical protein [Frigoriglobus tundricola]|uniref:Uncharacterized protein n=1 Tax=Frigoriglobus tundricola TaxID=2774151 RepID=A0A6M5YJ78_9BACT|nr:hypothetical protein [Frigoriglobus tundricola]QJW94119.1 hypothetical protein FTUN_1638 [Frigoriglobus tundricola]